MKKSRYGENAAIIGKVVSGEPGTVLLRTPIGGTRIVTVLYGEGLPRIC
jgi:hydrogenase expression/formation protein HypE